jgi:signal transduction histidine kinase
MIGGINRKSYWLLVAVTISLFPFLLFAGYSIVQLVQGKQDDLKQQLVDRTQATANVVAERLAVSAGALQALASSDAAQQGDIPAVYSQAKRVVQGMPDISAISLVTPDGQVQFLTLRPFGEKSFLAGDADAIRMVFETGKPMVSEPFASPIDKQIIITSVGVPVIRDGKVTYCIRAIFRNTSLNALLAAQHLPSDWTAGIVSRTGVLEARSRYADKFVGKPATVAVLDALASHRQGVFDSVTLEGNATKAVIAPIHGWDWSVVVGVPSRLFDEPLKQAIWFLFVFGMATLVLGGIFVSWVYFLMRMPSNGLPFDTGIVLSKVSSIWPSAVALVVALAIGVLSTQSSQNSLQNIETLTDRRQAIHIQRRKIVELLAAYTDIESGQRGFVITGDETFLASYRTAIPKIPLLTNVLKFELDRLEITNVNWADLAYFSDQRLAAAAKGIELRKQVGAKVIQDTEFFDHGKLLMDKLRFLLGNMESQLEAETLRINKDIDAQARENKQLQWLSQFAVGALVLLSISIWLYERRRRYAVLGELEKANATLEDRVATRTEALTLASNRIKKFAAETEAIVENERRRLSREVHDQIGQIFTGIKMIVRTLKPGSLPDDQQQAMMGAIESGVKISKRIAAELRPPLLDDFGIVAALENYLEATFAPLGIAFNLQFPEQSRLTAQQLNQLFRIVQEACTNVIRHAQASQVEVIGRFVQGGLEICIEDDGVGFDKAHVRVDALGLTGIEERAKLSGAVFSIEPREGGARAFASGSPWTP